MLPLRYAAVDENPESPRRGIEPEAQFARVPASSPPHGPTVGVKRQEKLTPLRH
jgi:hypothetical protein